MKKLTEIASVFLKLGFIGFGGPAAHIAMMQREIIEKRKWMSEQHFLDLMGATNLIPGPNSTEMTMHCGHERAGWKGLFVAGISFIFPAVLLTGLLAWFYVEYGDLPAVEPFLIGIKPAVLAIIAGAVFKLGKKALKKPLLYGLTAVVFALGVAGINEVLLIFAGGAAGMLVLLGMERQSNVVALPFILTTISWAKASSIFLTFLKVGAILYGSGYVLFAYLDAELVEKGLMSRQDLLDAVAMGQFTPGPVLSTSTFIGFQLGGWLGAVAATLGMFLPSFLFVWILNPLIPRMRKSKVLRHLLDAVNASAVAIMASVLVEMSIDSVVDSRSGVIAGLSAIAVFGPKKIGSFWVIICGSALGYLLYLI